MTESKVGSYTGGHNASRPQTNTVELQWLKP